MFKDLDPEVEGVGFMVEGSGLRVLGLGVRVEC